MIPNHKVGSSNLSGDTISTLTDLDPWHLCKYPITFIRSRNIEIGFLLSPCLHWLFILITFSDNTK